MAVVTINAQSVKDLGGYINYDSRFRAWAKVIGKSGDVDLSKTNGYSITSAFVNWGKSVAVQPGQFVVLSAESGSRARHSYSYAVIGVDADDKPFVVDDDAISAAVADATVPDAQRAKAANSDLYRIALYADVQMRADQPVGTNIRNNPAMDAAREAMRALTDDQRAAIVAEFSAPTTTGAYRFGSR